VIIGIILMAIININITVIKEEVLTSNLVLLLLSNSPSWTEFLLFCCSCQKLVIAICSSGGSMLGPGGTGPPNLAQAPQIFNWFYSNFA